VATAPAISLVRITVKAPHRWIDVALPADVPVAELLPHILRHAGEDTADAGERHAGWLLRRPVGDRLDPDRTLGAQRVLDGELLQLVPGEVEWPELEYEDLVETIASGARKYGRSWGKPATRRAGLVLCAVIVLAGLLVTPLFEAPWLGPGLVLLTAATVLLAVGVLVARAVPDAGAGAVFAGCSLPYAFAGGFLLAAPDHAALTDLGSRQLLLAATAMLVFGVAGFVGVAVLGRVFAAAIAVGVLGMLGGLVAGPLDPDGAAAVTLAVGIGLLPGYPLLAIRLGRLPLPNLPQRSGELFADDQPPPTPDVFAAAARTDEILSGLLTGLVAVTVVCAAVLATDDRAANQLMLAAVALALLLRARLFPIPRQRIPLLAGGGLAAAVLTGMRAFAADSNGALAVVVLVVIGAGLLVAVSGLVYSRRNPSPYLGRFGDWGDIAAILALVPLTCVITGFIGYVQTLVAGIG
jgi:type VII secretion integral membrane protein EccD